MSARKSKKTEEAALSFEAAMARLESVVRELEGPDIPLERALALFEEGVGLSRQCHAKLGEAEQKVRQLLRDKGGELVTRPFETGNDDDDNGGDDDAADDDAGDEAQSDGEESGEQDDEETDTLF